MECSLVFKILILSSSLVGFAASSDPAEIQRLKGFAEHQTEQKQFDRGRDRGEQEFLEESEQWERQRQQDLSEYRKSKKAAERGADIEGPDALEDARVKRAIAAEREEARQAYSKKVLKFDRDNQKGLVSEIEELDVMSNRPRYAQKGRVLYGAHAKYSQPKPVGGSSNSGFNSPPPASFNNNNSSPFPPPPSFDEFNDSGGFTPAPNMDNFGDDFPPPPPPPLMEPDGDFDFPPPTGEDFGF